MSRPIKVILILAAVTALASLGWAPVKATYFSPRRAKQARIASLTNDIDLFKQAAGEHVGVKDGIQGYVDRTLGGDLETVDHQLRSRLNRIGEELGLEALTVGTGRVRRLATPAKSHFRLAKRAIEAGLHTFVEKPLATTGDECQQLIDAADRKGVILKLRESACRMK